MRDDRERLLDIIEAIERIERVSVQGRKFSTMAKWHSVSGDPPPPDHRGNGCTPSTGSLMRFSRGSLEVDRRPSGRSGPCILPHGSR